MQNDKPKIGIYYIRNKINGKTYIGQSININRRVKSGHHGCSAIISAFEKYGKDNFENGVICYCDASELDDMETKYIEEFNTLSPNGYNISKYGDSPMRGRTITQEHKDSISKANKGIVRSEETKRKMSESKKGDKNYNFGKTASKETVLNMSLAHSGKNHHFYGKRLSEDHKNKIGKNRANKRKSISSSKYFGTSISRVDGKIYWRSYLIINNLQIPIYHGKDELYAAMKYDRYIIDNNIKNRTLNFPRIFYIIDFYILFLIYDLFKGRRH